MEGKWRLACRLPGARMVSSLSRRAALVEVVSWLWEESVMSPEQVEIILKKFEQPDEVRSMENGKFELVHIGGMTIGRATYDPGWKWSEHVGSSLGQTFCPVEHVGLVLAGTATAAFEDGTVYQLTRGTLFYIPPTPHDSWVVGDEPYVSLHFLGAEHYAK